MKTVRKVNCDIDKLAIFYELHVGKKKKNQIIIDLKQRFDSIKHYCNINFTLWLKHFL